MGPMPPRITSKRVFFLVMPCLPFLAELVLVTACSGPSEPPFDAPPAPVAAADVLCERPGFPQGIGQARYRLLDMDQGAACEVYLEQDECVLAIWQDCTDGSSNPREWQGQATVERQVELAPITAATTTGVAIPRSPACCVGPVAATGPIDWMLLDCRLDVCNSSNRRHAGLYLERWTDPAPALSVVESVPVTSTVDPTGTADALWDPDQNRGWLAWSDGGLFVRQSNGQISAVAELPSAHALAQDSDAVYAASGARLARIDKRDLTVSAEVTLPSDTLALTRSADGVLVAVASELGTTLYRFSSSLVLEIQRFHEGRATGLAARPSDGVVIATFDAPPRLVVLDGALNASQTVAMTALPELGVGDVVPHAPQWLDQDRVAFVGSCFSRSGKVHCYYEHSLTDAGLRTERIGVPDELRLTDFLPAGDGVWLTGSGGTIHRIDRAPMRPRPGVSTSLEAAATALVDTGDALWVLSSDGRVTVLSGHR